MKTIWQNKYVILVVILILYIIFLRECKMTPVAKDTIAIKKEVWDSIQKLANKPPIIKIDTIYKEGKIVYLPAPPLPIAIIDKTDSTVRYYNDSLVNKKINVHVNLAVRGQLISRGWSYKPIVEQITKTITEFVPQIVEYPIDKPSRKLFINMSAGGNNAAFLFGGGFDFVTKKNTEFGYIYQRYGNINFHSIKVGIKIF